MNLPELLSFMFWVAGGACAGYQIGYLIRPQIAPECALAGGILGFLILFIIFPFLHRKIYQWPVCRCGRVAEYMLPFVKDEKWGYLTKCECGRRYKARGQMWFEVQEDGTARLYRKQTFWCKWVEASNEEIANNALAPTVANCAGGIV